MLVYVESNFVLELAFRQEQAESCRAIMAACAGGRAKLVLPAFSIGESFHAFVGRDKDRTRAGETLRIQLGQLARSEVWGEEAAGALHRITGLLVKSAEQERAGLQSAIHEILEVAELIALDAEAIRDAGELERTLRLSPQDSLVLASVLLHLRRSRPQKSCFLNRNAKDFDDPDIVERLGDLRCKLLPSFTDGLGYIRSELGMAQRGSRSPHR